MRPNRPSRRWIAGISGIALLAPLAALLAPALLALLSWTVLPADAGTVGPAPNNTQTFSTSSSTNVTDETVEEDEHQTRVTAVRDGAVVFDETVDAPPGSGEVQALEAQAAAALAGPGCTATPVTVVASTRTQTGSTSTDTVTSTEDVVTLEQQLGPATIIIGDRDSGGTPHEIPLGTLNTNVNIETRTNVTRTTTNTYLNEEQRQTNGSCVGPATQPAAVARPAPVASAVVVQPSTTG